MSKPACSLIDFWLTMSMFMTAPSAQQAICWFKETLQIATHPPPTSSGPFLTQACAKAPHKADLLLHKRPPVSSLRYPDNASVPVDPTDSGNRVAEAQGIVLVDVRSRQTCQVAEQWGGGGATWSRPSSPHPPTAHPAAPREAPWTSKCARNLSSSPSCPPPTRRNLASDSGTKSSYKGERARGSKRHARWSNRGPELHRLKALPLPP